MKWMIEDVRNIFFNEKGTALYFAAKHGHEGIVKLLLERGADPTIKAISKSNVLKESKTILL